MLAHFCMLSLKIKVTPSERKGDSYSYLSLCMCAQTKVQSREKYMKGEDDFCQKRLKGTKSHRLVGEGREKASQGSFPSPHLPACRKRY